MLCAGHRLVADLKNISGGSGDQKFGGESKAVNAFRGGGVLIIEMNFQRRPAAPERKEDGMGNLETAERLLPDIGRSVFVAAAETAESADYAPLVDALRGGDRMAFERLYRRFAPMVHGVLLARVARSDVEDLMQDVFLQALQRLPTLRDSSAFGAWLAAMARNRAVDHFRRTRPTAPISEALNHPSRNGSLQTETEASAILETIRTLPDAYRETLVLRFVEGMTGPEIAACTGMTPESVRVNLHRGMKLLRGRLGMEDEQ
jgi:RNA polymerase sigma-70 factor, ECF subfamily